MIIYEVSHLRGKIIMKHGYEGADLAQLINNYKINDGKIVITFLDGDTYEIPYSLENEKELLKKMLFQAKKRSSSGALRRAEEERDTARTGAIVSTACIGGAVLFYGIGLSACMALGTVMGIMSGLVAVGEGLSYKHWNGVVEELEKYDIYLSMRQSLEKTQDQNLWSGVEGKVLGAITINTIDSLSLEDMQMIETNLERKEEYLPMFSHKAKVLRGSIRTSKRT